MNKSTKSSPDPNGSDSLFAKNSMSLQTRILRSLKNNKPLTFSLTFGLVGLIGLAVSLAAIKTTNFNGTLSQENPNQTFSYQAETGSVEATLGFNQGGSKGNGKGKNSFLPLPLLPSLTQTVHAAPPEGKGPNKDKVELSLTVYDQNNSIVKHYSSSSSFTVAFNTTDQRYTFEVTSTNILSAPQDFTLDVTLITQEADTTNPTISISTPSNDSTVSGGLTISGTANDNTGLSRIEVLMDDKAIASPVTGTSQWTTSVNSSDYLNGVHTIQAIAYDKNGNIGSEAIRVMIDNNPTTPPPDDGGSGLQEKIIQSNSDIWQLTNKRTPSFENRVVQPFQLRSYSNILDSFKLWIWDMDSDQQVIVKLPAYSARGYTSLSGAMTDKNNLWILGDDLGNGLILRHYRLSGTMPNITADLLKEQNLGDGDSRTNDMIRLSDNSLVALYAQQGNIGPQGHSMIRIMPNGSITEYKVPAWMRTKASRSTLAQHPVNNNLWLFNAADAWSSIGASVFSLNGSSFNVVSQNNQYISEADGTYDTDPELAFPIADSDKTNNTIVLAYQSGPARIRTSWGGITKIAVAHIDAQGNKKFSLMSRYIERTNWFAMSVDTTGITIMHREPNHDTGIQKSITVSKLIDGVWSYEDSAPSAAYSDPLTATTGSAIFVTRMSDQRLHVFKR